METDSREINVREVLVVAGRGSASAQVLARRLARRLREQAGASGADPRAAACVGRVLSALDAVREWDEFDEAIERLCEVSANGFGVRLGDGMSSTAKR